MATKRRGSGHQGSSNSVTQDAAALQKALAGVGGGGAGASPGAGSPTATGIKTSQANLPIPFSLPNQQSQIPAPAGATTNAQGQTIATYAQVAASYFKLDPAELQYVQEQMANGHMISAKDVTGHTNASTQNAWNRIALDSANSGVSFTTLLNMGASSGDYANMLYELQYAVSTEQRQLAEIKQGTYTQTDPNQIKQAVVSAFASIGEAAPSPQFLDHFVQAYHAQESQAEVGVLQSEKTNFRSALNTLESEQAQVEQGNPNALSSLQASIAAPVAAVGRATPNLDAEAMAQAKATDPAEYYATQSSYLYGLLLNDIRGTPNYQTSPSAPSQTAPGGAVVGTPLIPASAPAGAGV